MRVVVQRVEKASVSIQEKQISAIGKGLLVLLGVENDDSQDDINWLCKKISNLRIFDDDEGIMNKSLCDNKGEILLVSQFTLHANVKKGNRPSYIRAAKPEISLPMYKKFKEILEIETQSKVQMGEFGADMQVSLVNDGPVTIIIDSKNKDF